MNRLDSGEPYARKSSWPVLSAKCSVATPDAVHQLNE